MTLASAAAAFDDFAAAFELERYSPLPDGWAIAVSDVVDSTAAIGRGRYKDVNMAGGMMALCSLCQPLLDVIQITKMDRVLKVYPDRPKALAEIAGKG